MISVDQFSLRLICPGYNMSRHIRSFLPWSGVLLSGQMGSNRTRKSSQYTNFSGGENGVPPFPVCEKLENNSSRSGIIMSRDPFFSPPKPEPKLCLISHRVQNRIGLNMAMGSGVGRWESWKAGKQVKKYTQAGR